MLNRKISFFARPNIMMHFVAKSKTSMEVNGWENNEAILRGGGKLVENVGEARLAIRSAAKLAFSDKYGTVGNFLVFYNVIQIFA